VGNATVYVGAYSPAGVSYGPEVSTIIEIIISPPSEYPVTFAEAGLDATAVGTVVTINGIPEEFTDLPLTVWFGNGSILTYLYSNVISSSTIGKQFILRAVVGPSSPVTVTGPLNITGNYMVQYQVTFNVSGVGIDFTGTVVTVDSVNYTVSGLPVSFWWDSGSSHTFAFHSPLVVSSTKQYVWSSTSGLSSLQSGALNVTASGSVVGNYVVQTPTFKVPLWLFVAFTLASGTLGALVLLLFLAMLAKRRRRKRRGRNSYTIIVHPHV
jgi:hypothetical protein